MGPEEIASFTGALQALSRILGLRENFLIDLLKDPDDWSFIVKAHALLEAVVCAVLVVHLQKRELDDVLAEEVEMKARIEMTKALGITTPEDRKAMHALGSLRNRLVHNVKDTNFTFVEYFKNKDVKRNFCSTFGHGWADPVSGTMPPMSRAEYVGANPKVAVFHSVLHVALYVVSEISKIQTDLAVEGLRAATASPPGRSAGKI